MKYNKPEVVLVTSAADAVQTQQMPKSNPVTIDQVFNLPASSAAYEADE
jgi:hypothetical protein